jgi:DNA modification methylase
MESRILVGDALAGLRTLPEKSVNMVFTSPPYFQQKDYEDPDQIGWEDNPDAFVDRLCDVFDEVRRVLRDDGTCYVNLGDTYTGKGQCLIPQRFALEMERHEWIPRNDLIWVKTNGLSSSTKDRFPCCHEPIYFFAKGSSYYFKQPYEARVTDPMDEAWQWLRNQHPYFKARLKKGSPRSKHGGKKPFMDLVEQAKLGRKVRTVWSTSVGHSQIDHPAPFPQELAARAILASCPAGGTVLDPFFGSGSTGLAAMALGRKFIGIEINEEYVREALGRIENAA